MKNRIAIAIIGFCFLLGCVKDLQKAGVSDTTKLRGRVLEESAQQPLSNVKVMVTDGKTNYLNTTTDKSGEFVLEVDFARIDKDSYVLIIKDDEFSEINKKLDLKGMGKETYDYEDVFLYNLNDGMVPTVVTNTISDIEETSAVCGGNVTEDGGSAVLERGVCWSVNQNPTIADHIVDAEGTTGPFNCTLTGLSPDTKYYVRAFAVNKIGVSYGVSRSFTTLEEGSNHTPPEVKTNEVTLITSGSAVCGGNISSDGGEPVLRRGICWSTTPHPEENNAQTALDPNNSTGSYSCTMTGLTPTTTYYVRAFAVNKKGISYGEEKSFTTLEEMTEAWLYYGDPSTWNNSCWGFVEGGEGEWAIMLPAESLIPYEGMSIEKVKNYFPVSGDYTLRIYEGGTEAPAKLKKTGRYNITDPGWYNLLLNAAYELNTSKNLWVSLSLTYDAGYYPMAVYDGINEPNSRWSRYNGGNWFDFYTCNGERDLTWAIRVYVTKGEKGSCDEEFLLPMDYAPTPPSSSSEVTIKPVGVCSH